MTTTFSFTFAVACFLLHNILIARNDTQIELPVIDDHREEQDEEDEEEEEEATTINPSQDSRSRRLMVENRRK